MSELTQVTLSLEAAPELTWAVHSVRVEERFSCATRIEVAASVPEGVDFDRLIGTGASLEIAFARDDERRAFHGMIFELDEQANAHRQAWVEFVIRSRLAVLELGRDHRIFQEMTVPEIVDDVLSRAGLSELVEWRVNRTYEPHANVVQYAESDAEFVARLLSEEGIAYFVDNDEAGETLVLFDDDTAHVAIDGDSLVSYVPVRAADRRGLLSLACAHRMASDQVSLRDYDLTRPAVDQTVQAEAPAPTGREIYLHPGSYQESGRGDRLAQDLLERARVGVHRVRGETNLSTFAPGRYWTAAELPHVQAERDYLLCEVVHEIGVAGDAANMGSEWAHRCHFEAIPMETPFRPPACPRPKLGVQPALATVPGGEEIHSEEFGRTKARFLWDRSGILDDQSSTWMRVGQLALGGSMILPRVDFELLVDVELDDLDRPAVSGHVYNDESPPPYALPGGATVSSFQTATTGGGPGANELRFEDSAGSEEIYVNASRDLIASVDNDTSWRVGNNQVREVGGDQTVSVTLDHSNAVTGSREHSVGVNQSVDIGGSLGSSTGKNLSVSITGNRMVTVGGDHGENTNGSLSRTVGSLSAVTGIAGVGRTVVKSAKTDVGLAWAEVAGSARGLNITGSYSETVGALKLVKAKNVSITCDQGYVVNGAAELVKAGGSRTDTAEDALAITAGGKFEVKAKNIVFEAQDKLVFRGGAASIELKSNGEITIKAPDVKVKNAKALKQLMHKSN